MGAWCVSLLVPFLVSPGAERPQRVAIVCDEKEPMRVLAEFLERGGIQAEVQDQAEFRRALPGLRVDAILMYVHGLLEDDVEEALLSYAEEGGRLVLLHHAIASGRNRNKRWLPTLGIAIRPRDSGPQAWNVLVGDVQVANLNPGHYITTHHVSYPKRVAYTPSDAPSAEQELPAFELPNTEAFQNQVFTDGRRKTVLLGFQVTLEGKRIAQDRAGWTMPLGKGHVVYIQQGHRADDFRDPCLCQIIRNAIEWRPNQ